MKNDRTPVVERADEVCTDVAQSGRSAHAPRPYKVICISLYREDIEQLDAKVAELKRRGVTKANKSWLIRLALAELDLDKAEKLAKGSRL